MRKTWWMVVIEDDDSTACEYIGPYRERSPAQAFAELVQARLVDNDSGLVHVTVMPLSRLSLVNLRDAGWID